MAVVAYATAHAGRLGALVLAVAAIGVAALVVALAARLAGPLPWAIALLGASYVASLLLRGGAIDAFAPAVAVGLLLVAELSYWSIERAVPAEAGLSSRRIGHLGILALAGGGAAALVLAVSEVVTGGGLGLEALGVAAAAGVLALVTALARRTAT